MEKTTERRRRKEEENGERLLLGKYTDWWQRSESTEWEKKKKSRRWGGVTVMSCEERLAERCRKELQIPLIHSQREFWNEDCHHLSISAFITCGYICCQNLKRNFNFAIKTASGGSVRELLVCQSAGWNMFIFEEWLTLWVNRGLWGIDRYWKCQR